MNPRQRAQEKKRHRAMIGHRLARFYFWLWRVWRWQPLSAEWVRQDGRWICTKWERQKFPRWRS